MTEQVYSMKQMKMPAAIPLITLVASLAACGGGGDDAGSPVAFSTVPTTLTVTAPTAANGGPAAGKCVAAFAGEIFVYGGAAPYRLDNTVPDAIVLNKTTVSDRGGSFTATFTGVCITPATIVVVDKLNNNVIVTFNNRPSA